MESLANKAVDVVLSVERKKQIEKIVDKIVKEYGETLRMLGKE